MNYKLRPYEYRVMQRFLAGKSDKEIEYDLGLAPTTVKGYFAGIKRAANVNSRVNLVMWAYARPEDLDLWPRRDETLFPVGG